MMPSPADLSYFLEVSSSLNLSRASERLGISQPSLSLAIQRLERSVGTPLLIRGKKGVTLTQSGKQLLSHTRELLQSWESVKAKTLASTLEIEGSYTLGCHPSVALYSLSKFLPSLLEDHPKLEIKLVHDLSRKVAESVIRMRTDIGIVVNPTQHPDLVIKKLCDDEVTFWVGRGSRKTQDIYSGGAVLVCDPDLIQTEVLVKKIKKSGIHYRRVLESSSLEVVTDLVTHGAGVGILPGRVAAAANARGLKKISKAPIFHDQVCLIYRVENRSVKSIQAIAEKIAEAFR